MERNNYWGHHYTLPLEDERLIKKLQELGGKLVIFTVSLGYFFLFTLIYVGIKLP